MRLFGWPRRYRHHTNATQNYVIVHCLCCSFAETWLINEVFRVSKIASTRSVMLILSVCHPISLHEYLTPVQGCVKKSVLIRELMSICSQLALFTKDPVTLV
jgi:hypothetical protein